MNSINKWKERVKHLKTETYAIYLAYKDPRVPWYAKILIAFVVAHTFSPIDLIPDFIPILGYLDDLVIAPLGIALAIRMIPQDVLTECREKAQASGDQDKPTNWVAAAVCLTDTLPVSLTLTVGPVCSGGTCGHNVGNRAITWTGDVVPRDPVIITYTGLVSVPIGTTDTICLVNAAQVNDGKNAPLKLSGQSCANPRMAYLPLVIKSE